MLSAHAHAPVVADTTVRAAGKRDKRNTRIQRLRQVWRCKILIRYVKITLMGWGRDREERSALSRGGSLTFRLERDLTAEALGKLESF